jgi:hypothetical protein
VLLSYGLPTWPHEGLEGWALGGIALAITLVAATLSYRFVEQPVRRGGFRATARAVLNVPSRSLRALGASLAMVAAVALAGGGVVAVLSDPGRGETEAIIAAGQQAIADAGAAPAPQGPPSAQLASGDQITAIGDSVMLAAAPTLQQQFPGIAIDAAVSRSMYAAPGIVQAQLDAGSLRKVVVVALGTNGPIELSTLDQIRAIIGPDRELIVVNAQAPRGWIPGVNAELSSFALVYRNVELANWHDAAQPILGELARDQIHFGPIGAGVFTGTIEAAVERLAELPPLRDDSTALAVPTPE